MLILSALGALAPGCRKKPAAQAPLEVRLPPQPEWPFEAQAIRLRYQADPDLNQEDDAPHAILLVVYQMKDINAFNDRLKTAPGLRTLLDGGMFDPAVTAADRIFIQPGTEDFALFDRAAGTKWLAVVAGYYGLQGPAMARAAALPQGNGQGFMEACVDLALGAREIRGFTLTCIPR